MLDVGYSYAFLDVAWPVCPCFCDVCVCACVCVCVWPHKNGCTHGGVVFVIWPNEPRIRWEYIWVPPGEYD